MSPDAYKADLGISGLCSVRGIERVDLGFVLRATRAVWLCQWLKEAMESSEEGGEVGTAVSKQ
jgi:hypothetical protein